MFLKMLHQEENKCKWLSIQENDYRAQKSQPCKSKGNAPVNQFLAELSKIIFKNLEWFYLFYFFQIIPFYFNFKALSLEFEFIFLLITILNELKKQSLDENLCLSGEGNFNGMWMLLPWLNQTRSRDWMIMTKCLTSQLYTAYAEQ